MINNGDVAFIIIATVLVLIMIPGLAFFYGGLVEKEKLTYNHVPNLLSYRSCRTIMDIWWV